MAYQWPPAWAVLALGAFVLFSTCVSGIDYTLIYVRRAQVVVRDRSCSGDERRTRRMMEQLPLRMRLRDSARFESFVAGANVQACTALQGERPRLPHVVWLWGRAGTGKSHLLQAACAAAGERGDAAAYVDLALAPSSEMLDGCDALALVCLDGLDAVAAEPAWNAAIFRLHTLLQDGTGRLVIASTAPPAGLGLTLPDLRSRLLAADITRW